MTEDILEEIAQEVSKAESLHPPYNSPHEGWAVMEEELHEVREEIYANKVPGALQRMRAEALQLAGTAVRFIQMLDAKRENKAQTSGSIFNKRPSLDYPGLRKRC